MKIANVTWIATLFCLFLPSTLLAGDYWIRCSGSFNMLDMSDFNDGIARMNDLVQDDYKLDYEAMYPEMSDARIAAKVDSATNNMLLDELDNGLGFSIALARRLGSTLCAGVELERMIATKDAIYNPVVAQSYSAPVTMFKFFVNTHIKERDKVSLGLGGAVGYAQATGSLRIPVNNPRTAMRDAYLSGGGIVFEGHFLTHYRLEEGLSLCATLGYRVAKLDESDQYWFRESGAVEARPDQMELKDDIPLQLDFSGIFLKVGFQANMPW